MCSSRCGASSGWLGSNGLIATNAVTIRFELLGVEHRPVALDHTALLQPADPLLGGGGGQAGLLADVGVGHPAVPREQRQDGLVQLFHGVIVPVFVRGRRSGFRA